jgi:hypothetical protein
VTLPAAALFLALSFTADEMGTSAALRAGAQERGFRRAEVRWAIKGSTVPVYLVLQKKSKLVRIGFPVVFLAAGAWNLRQAHSCKGGHCG